MVGRHDSASVLLASINNTIASSKTYSNAPTVKWILLALSNGAASLSGAGESVAHRTPDAFSNAAWVRGYQKTITASSMAARLYFLASDEFEGRETTTLRLYASSA
jgi:hypothetical protein